ncbi:hypothetical protein [Methylobacterium sp. Leaf108]|uniref:hypothetical protein n=1 Tax=Methylobacterium sp. Leaf108 TaxID=1736256 RepID=UPI0006F5D3E9|nr:hypothetical protein [Methylobacterium sp. Leaf108]KQP61049.1 hypothetical protein ASF39_15345 [Methylobacterium sp. Leaf108]
MAPTPEQQAALTRLLSLYNNAAYDPDGNPGGLANGGHRPNFIRALADIALAGAAVSSLSSDVATVVGQALTAYGSSGALTTAVAAAQAAQAAAQNAVGGGRVGKNTFEDVGGVVGSGLGSSLNYPDGAIGEVFTGLGAGYYTKSGTSGTGSWVKKDDTTVPGLNVRTQGVPLTKATAEDVLRYLSEILGRYDDVPGYSWVAARDPLGQIPLAVGTEGDIVLRDWRVVAAPSDSGFSYAIWDANGTAPFAIADGGLTWCVLDPASWLASQREATLPATTAIAAGAQGTVYDVLRDGQFLRYKATPDGPAMPYLVRTDRVGGPNFLDTASRLAISISYGQSWRADTIPIDPTKAFYAAGEPRIALTLARDQGAIQTIGAAFQTQAIVDLIGIQNSLGSNIGYVSTQSEIKFGRRNNRHLSPILEFCHAYPGYRWDQLKPGTDPWQQGLNMIAAARVQAARYGKTPWFRNINWTHAGAPDSNNENYFQSLTEMVAAYDALALNGPGGDLLHFFTDQTAASINQGQAQLSYLDQVRFAVENAARVHLIGPRYPYPFRDEIHHTDYGIGRVGELEGYVRDLVLNRGLTWDCARVSAVSGENGGFTFAITTPPTFGALAFDTTEIEEAANKGFQLRVNGVPIPIASVTLTGNLVRVIPVTMPAAGTVVEVSYAFYGRLDIPAGTHSGAWGNVKRVGPASLYWPGLTVDTWLCAYRSTITV